MVVGSLRGQFATNNSVRNATHISAPRPWASTAHSPSAVALLPTGGGSASTSRRRPTEARWHAATVEGSRREEALDVLGAAWPRVAQRFPGRNLAGWRIAWTDTSIDLAAYPTALCGTA